MSPSPIVGGAPSAPRISVVIPTYERAERVARLVDKLGEQTLPASELEVVVIDDGSKTDPRPLLSTRSPRFRLIVDRQENQGPPAARHRGVALASAPILLFLDDDMIPVKGLLEEHLRVHDTTPRAVVMGNIKSSEALRDLTVFERFHAKELEDYWALLRTTGRAPRGMELCTGNVSMRRADYLAAGGFDQSLHRSEDADLGIRLEKSGVTFRYADAAAAIHDSDHASLDAWLKNAFIYGISEHRIAQKHVETPEVSPWHWLDIMSVLPRPAYALSVAAPRVSAPLVRAVMDAAERFDAAGLEGPAIKATTLAYGMEYFRGVRTEAGSLAACARDLVRYRRLAKKHGSRAPKDTPLERFLTSVRADRAMMAYYDQKYDTRGRGESSFSHDVIERIGLQMMIAVRLMRLSKELGVPLGAKIVSRLIRFLYTADIHWDAEFADGVVINHGMGLGVGHGARIGKGVILAHNVGLGAGIDPVTRVVGAPTIEDDVHFGPGAFIAGPVTIGARSKIMPNALVVQSIPPDSVVETPSPRIIPRAARRTKSDSPRPSAELGAPPPSVPARA